MTDERYQTVKTTMEGSAPGVRVERAGATVRIHIDRYDIPKDRAEQLATMAYTRLGDDSKVIIYDASGRKLASADIFGERTH